MAVHTMSLIQVSRGNARIMAVQAKAPPMQVNAGHRTLKGRGRSGRVLRR